MDKREKIITLPCDCKCCMLTIEKTIWENGDICYDISIQDSRYDHGYNTVWGRIKRAASVLLGKPVYFNNVHLEGDKQYAKLVHDMTDLFKSNLIKYSERAIPFGIINSLDPAKALAEHLEADGFLF